ncbi:MAG: AAA family ATPase [Chloroflexi bacterium]|nr:AAA family ATPase [Chloroflexota bacterium]
MTFLAIAGKGGTGKTTLAALLIKHIMGFGIAPVLAIDADPNANLDKALGIKYAKSIADVIEESKEIHPDQLPAGMTRDRFIELRLQEALEEGNGLDLLVMGTPEGPGCYCYANTLLQKHLEGISKSYKVVVMDNEAGMEHLSRRTARNVDNLFIVSEPTPVGLESAVRIAQVARKLKITAGKEGLVLARAPEKIPGKVMEEAEKSGLELWGTIPYDPLVYEFVLEGKPLLDLPDDAVSVKAAGGIMDTLFQSWRKIR